MGPRLIQSVRRLNADSGYSIGTSLYYGQGQYLAFIVAYTKLNRRAPAEADLQPYCGVTPPSVHGMIVTLERRGLIRRIAGRARSSEVLGPLDDVPSLD